MYDSPQFVLHVKRWISESYSHCWKGLKYAKDAGKTKECAGAGGFF